MGKSFGASLTLRPPTGINNRFIYIYTETCEHFPKSKKRGSMEFNGTRNLFMWFARNSTRTSNNALCHLITTQKDDRRSPSWLWSPLNDLWKCIFDSKNMKNNCLIQFSVTFKLHPLPGDPQIKFMALSVCYWGHLTTTVKFYHCDFIGSLIWVINAFIWAASCNENNRLHQII